MPRSPDQEVALTLSQRIAACWNPSAVYIPPTGTKANYYCNLPIRLLWRPDLSSMAPAKPVAVQRETTYASRTNAK